MPRLRLAFGIVAAAGVASVGCTLNRSEQCCPTDARRIVYSCAGQEAVRQGPCGPNEAYYGHHPTCWGSWPQGWEQYKSDHCVTTAAVAECDCEEGIVTASESSAVGVEPAPTSTAPFTAEPVEAAPAISASWPETPLPEASLPEPTIEPITPRPALAPEPMLGANPAPAPLSAPPSLPAPTRPVPSPRAPTFSAPSLPAPSAPPTVDPPDSPPSASTSGALPTYEELLRKRPVRSSKRPVFGPPPARSSVGPY